MGKWKWILGGLTWVLTGPIGGLIGFLIGSAIDGFSSIDTSSKSQSYANRTRHTEQGDFMVVLLTLSAAVMKADNIVKKSELDYVKSFLVQNFGKEKTLKALQILKPMLNTEIPLDDVCRQISKSYELFAEMFCLIVAIADHAEYKIEFNRNKLLPTEEDLNPNRKFVDNKIIQAFRSEPTIKKYMEKATSNWSEHYEFVRNVFNKMANSEFYKKYMEDENRSIKQDADVICKIINKYLIDNTDLDEILESESIFWNDDLEFSLSNLIQTIKKLNDDNIENFRLPAMFKNEEDREFAKTLIKNTCLYRQKFDELIEKNLQKWELQRIAFMDRVILHLALCEMTQFPELPVRVTINEYIDIAKGYSTEKSGTFVNGILDKIYNQIKDDKSLNKIGMGLL